jgi:hypothetical protein
MIEPRPASTTDVGGVLVGGVVGVGGVGVVVGGALARRRSSGRDGCDDAESAMAGNATGGSAVGSVLAGRSMI